MQLSDIARFVVFKKVGSASKCCNMSDFYTFGFHMNQLIGYVTDYLESILENISKLNQVPYVSSLSVFGIKIFWDHIQLIYLLSYVIFGIV